MAVGLDAVRQAGQIAILEQFPPAGQIERGLSSRRMELDCQRHWKQFIVFVQARQVSEYRAGTHDLRAEIGGNSCIASQRALTGLIIAIMGPV
jgi:hypothetical protein